ncbi:GvpL/GvpF family gas vesicle protein [Micromonospora olivasterospora]|uniref:Gas vesicle protein GvpL/GvpF n=1 Tax=Micromonospora olivasterospora TaxID=1880 RepID=A0A562IE12_MICOL|nr:GvpL/GvpF family gas vesicle protein [Micromonospora olivasterospora]TWH69076.1 gas vesicle protein GvpL/GvpF [Micromonospora olivasterospora]
MPVVVYGLVRSAHQAPEGLAGVGEPPGPVRLIRNEHVAVAVSDVIDEALRDDDAVAFLDVLRTLLEGGPVLPVRFGTVAPDDDAVATEILEPLADEGADRLDQLDGLVEVQLILTADEDAELRELLASSPELRRMVAESRQGAADLNLRISVGEQVSEALGERRAELSEDLVGRLGPLAVDHGARVRDEVTTLTQFYLVRAQDLGQFDDAVQQLRDDLGDRYDIEYVGPLPPLDFASGQVQVPQPRPRESTSGRWGW